MLSLWSNLFLVLYSFNLSFIFLRPTMNGSSVVILYLRKKRFSMYKNIINSRRQDASVFISYYFFPSLNSEKWINHLLFIYILISSNSCTFLISFICFAIRRREIHFLKFKVKDGWIPAVKINSQYRI